MYEYDILRCIVLDVCLDIISLARVEVNVLVINFLFSDHVSGSMVFMLTYQRLCSFIDMARTRKSARIVRDVLTLPAREPDAVNDVSEEEHPDVSLQLIATC